AQQALGVLGGQPAESFEPTGSAYAGDDGASSSWVDPEAMPFPGGYRRPGGRLREDHHALRRGRRRGGAVAANQSAPGRRGLPPELSLLEDRGDQGFEDAIGGADAQPAVAPEQALQHRMIRPELAR